MRLQSILLMYFDIYLEKFNPPMQTCDAELLFRRHGENDEQKIPYKSQNQDFGGDCVYRLQQHVVEHFVSGSQLMNTASDYIANIMIADAAYVSDKTSACIRPRIE